MKGTPKLIKALLGRMFISACQAKPFPLHSLSS